MLQSLATDKDVEDVITLFHEFFDSNPQDTPTDVPILQRHQPPANPFGLPVDGADTGAEFEAKMSTTALGLSLGFIDDIPILFNVYRHKDGITSWQAADAFKVAEGQELPKHLERLQLHWHQLAGVHAIIRMCFTPKPDENHCAGVLVADEVGLGKTYQSATVIAFLAAGFLRQSERLEMPPLLSE
jgi:SNF2 family DNA or RNA helicase